MLNFNFDNVSLNAITRTGPTFPPCSRPGVWCSTSKLKRKQSAKSQRGFERKIRKNKTRARRTSSSSNDWRYENMWSLIPSWGEMGKVAQEDFKQIVTKTPKWRQQGTFAKFICKSAFLQLSVHTFWGPCYKLSMTKILFGQSLILF